MVAAAVLAVVYGLTRVWFVVLPVFVALLLATVLVPLVTGLEARRWPTLAAAWAVFGGFVLLLVGIGLLIVPAIADEFSGLGATLTQGVDNVERWLVRGPLGLEPDELARYRKQAAHWIGGVLRSSSGGLVVGAVVAGIIASLVALVSGGTGDALLVAAIALLVQQFDNDLLAPLIYGRAINLHPAVILITLSAGGALAGVAGAFLAVPVAAMAAAVGNELWTRYGDAWRSGANDAAARAAAG